MWIDIGGGLVNIANATEITIHRTSVDSLWVFEVVALYGSDREEYGINHNYRVLAHVEVKAPADTGIMSEVDPWHNIESGDKSLKLAFAECSKVLAAINSAVASGAQYCSLDGVYSVLPEATQVQEGSDPTDEEWFAAERATLGCMLLDKAAIPVVIKILDRNDFSSDQHKAIFDALCALDDRDEPVDLITVKEELERREKFDVAGGVNYLADLFETTSHAGNAEYFAKIVRSRHSRD